MIVWINGPFGVGKTTTAARVVERTGWRAFDPEHVGYLLAGNLQDLAFDDFQDLPPWRELVPVVAEAIHRFTRPEVMLAVQTVLVEQYWTELTTGFRDLGLDVAHVVLDCDEAELRRRIETDETESQALDWRLDHLAMFESARQWLTGAADLLIDTTALTADAVAERVTGAVAGR